MTSLVFKKQNNQIGWTILFRVYKITISTRRHTYNPTNENPFHCWIRKKNRAAKSMKNPCLVIGKTCRRNMQCIWVHVFIGTMVIGWCHFHKPACIQTYPNNQEDYRLLHCFIQVSRATAWSSQRAPENVTNLLSSLMPGPLVELLLCNLWHAQRSHVRTPCLRVWIFCCQKFLKVSKPWKVRWNDTPENE